MASRTINIPATTNLDADELTSGTVPFARLSTGTGSTQVAVGYRQGQITRPSAAAWHHYRFVLRRDGNLPKCTVDGVVQTVGNRFSQGTVSGTFTNSTLYVMSRAGASLFGDGRMVGLAVFPGEVSDADAARLAAAT